MVRSKRPECRISDFGPMQSLMMKEGASYGRNGADGAFGSTVGMMSPDSGISNVLVELFQMCCVVGISEGCAVV